MAKKESQVFIPEQETPPAASPAEEPVLYESEAYGSPQPDEGATTTVMKPVGIGGPVPIVAPKHNTIQLQPIVVPLAVVPYMTQDSDILRTESGRKGDDAESAASAAEFQRAEQATRHRAHSKACKRAFSAVMLFFSALMVAAFVTSYIKPELAAEYVLFKVDVIGQIKFWVEFGEPVDYCVTIVNAVAAACAAAGFVIALWSLALGRYPRKTFMLLTFLAAAAYAAEIIYEVVEEVFLPDASVDVFTMLAIAGIAFILSVIFAAVCIKREDREDVMLRSDSEI